MRLDTALLESQVKRPGLTAQGFDGLLELAALKLEGPIPPPEFIDNGCGPAIALDSRWGRAVGWLMRALIPDSLYGYSLRLPCRFHDWAWSLSIWFRHTRARNPDAKQRLLEYAYWLRIETSQLWEIELRKADGDAFLRANIRQYLKAQGAGAFLCWRVSVAYWLGVRFGAGIGGA